jgi:hypothetical protein
VTFKNLEMVASPNNVGTINGFDEHCQGSTANKRPVLNHLVTKNTLASLSQL